MAAAKKKSSNSGAAPAVGDARFQKVHNDPRFARLSTKKNKLQIDKRFAAVLRDDKFQSVQGKYDKYGRRIQKKENELKKFYHLDEEENGSEKDREETGDIEEQPSRSRSITKLEGKSASSTDESGTDGDEENDAEGDEKMSRLDYLNRMARGELESGSESSDESDASDNDVEMESGTESEKEDIPLGEETTRFAVMNCDWSRIRAVDLFALFQSFAPATGAVKNVTIYPSDFGLQRMKEEEEHGPRQLWEDRREKEQKDQTDSKRNEENRERDDDDDSVHEGNSDSSEGGGGESESDSEDPLGVKQTVTANDSDGFDVEKLRKYELQKLKYYYAVVTCDSVKTAATIYESCDQLEYETSANLLDLRFIPDDMEFKNPAKESCTSIPETYKPSIFATQALQQTEVKLTWEEDDDRRMELLTRQAEWKNAHDDDFAAYLASENSSSEGEDQNDSSDDGDNNTGSKDSHKSRSDGKKALKLKKIKNRYRKMLLGSDAEDSNSSDEESGKINFAGSDSEGESDNEKPEDTISDKEDDSADQSANGNMEMSFNPGAGDILRTKKQKELLANETPFERYIREKKEEKNRKRHEKRAQQKEQAREQKQILKKRGKAAPEQLKALRAAIDGSEDNDSDGSVDVDRNFDMKKIAQSEKVKKLKGKRKNKEMRKLEKTTGLQEGFEFDAADPRFSKLYEKGSQFQLDPTDPKFKKSDATQAIFQERRKRQSQPVSRNLATEQIQEVEKDKDSKSQLKAMVESLKRKATPQVGTKSRQTAKPFKKPKF